MTARTSRTPALTADSATNSRSVWAATTLASVVLPVPGGPHRIIDDSRSASISARSGAPGPSRCGWPTISSRVRGRIRAASGACWASHSRNAVSTGSSGGGPARVLRAGTRRRLPVARTSPPRPGHRRRRLRTGGRWWERRFPAAAGMGAPPAGAILTRCRPGDGLTPLRIYSRRFPPGWSRRRGILDAPRALPTALTVGNYPSPWTPPWTVDHEFVDRQRHPMTNFVDRELAQQPLLNTQIWHDRMSNLCGSPVRYTSRKAPVDDHAGRASGCGYRHLLVSRALARSAGRVLVGTHWRRPRRANPADLGGRNPGAPVIG